MGTFLVFVRDPGSVNGALPVADALEANGHRVILYAEGAAVPIVSKTANWNSGFRITEPYFSRSQWREDMQNCDAVITTIASNGGTPREIVLDMRREFPDIPIVLMDENYAAGFAQEWGDPKYRPDWVVCINDGYAEQCIREAWPELDPERLVLSGYPALDKYARVQIPEMQRQVRARLNLVKDRFPVVTFLGQDTGTGEAYELLVQTMVVNTHPAYLVPRLHPRMRLKGEWPDDLAAIRRASQFYAALFLSEDSYDIETPDLIAGSDLVVSLDSTGLMEAAVLRIPNIAIRTPHFIAIRQAMGVTKLPASIILGCTAQATSPSELTELLNRFYRDRDLGLRPMQDAAYVIDGQNASRTAQFLESLIRSK